MNEEKKAAVVIPEAPVTQAVETMSHRQLRAELKRVTNRKYDGKSFVMGGVDLGDNKIKSKAGLDNAFAVILGAVLDNTRMDVQVEPKRFARKDQIGPGKLNSYLV